MSAPIIFVAGSKGGVGKSVTSMAVLDYLTSNTSAVVKLIETDTSNPDVWKSYGKVVESEQLNLDDVEGWIQLVNACDAHPFKTIVVNTPARNNAGVIQHGAILLNALKELGRPLITLWVINRQRDSLELLREYLTVMPAGTVHVVQNAYFGDASKFQLYLTSPLREVIAEREGKDLVLPDLSDAVTDQLYTKRLTLAEASQQMKIGDRMELQRWRDSVTRMLVSIGF
jgi:dethiobiotin synthetase